MEPQLQLNSFMHPDLDLPSQALPHYCRFWIYTGKITGLKTEHFAVFHPAACWHSPCIGGQAMKGKSILACQYLAPWEIWLRRLDSDSQGSSLSELWPCTASTGIGGRDFTGCFLSEYDSWLSLEVRDITGCCKQIHFSRHVMRTLVNTRTTVMEGH